MSEEQKVQQAAATTTPTKTEGTKEVRKFSGDRRGGFNRDNKGGDRGGFNRGNRGFGNKGGGNNKGGFKGKKGGRGDRRKRGNELDSDLFSEVISVRRVTRVAKGGKRMRFSALVVVGDKKGKVGYAIRKGVDFQSALAKASKKASESMIKIEIDENGSVPFETATKYKAARIFLKPAKHGTGLIAGGYARPVLDLAGISNVYSKIIGGTNKISGVQAVMKALSTYAKKS